MALASIDAPASSGSTVLSFSTGSVTSTIPDGGALLQGISVPGTTFGTVLDVDLSVRLSHPSLSQIDITLIAPDGTQVQLATDLAGGGGYGSGSTSCGGQPTVFDDEAAVFASAAMAPYAGAIRPERPLSAFDGRLGTGVWTVRITDDTVNGVGGTLHCATLTFRRGAAPGDLFFMDGQADLAVWRPSAAAAFFRSLDNTSQGFQLLGASGDIPVPANYDGEGLENSRVFFRPSTGGWTFTATDSIPFGINGDVPVPGDYNGNGVADIAVWRPSDGVWYLRNIGNVHWGTAGDIPVPADYNGDGTTDLAVWRPSEGVWYVKDVTTVVWGVAGDIPVPADYDGDGRADIAIFRPSSGLWFLLAANGQQIGIIPWGTVGDIPVPADYDGDGKADIAVFRGSDGGWYLRNIGVIAFGAPGDIPLPKRPTYPGYPF